MNIRHIWTIACRESIINQDSNNISLLNSLEQIEFTLSPLGKSSEKTEHIAVPFNYEVISYWVKEDDKKKSIEVKVSFIDPKGKTLGNNVSEGIFPEGIQRLRTRLKVSGMTLSIPGRYLIQIEMRESSSGKFDLYSEVPIDIKIIFVKPELASLVKN